MNFSVQEPGGEMRMNVECHFLIFVGLAIITHSTGSWSVIWTEHLLSYDVKKYVSFLTYFLTKIRNPETINLLMMIQVLIILILKEMSVGQSRRDLIKYHKFQKK